MRMNVAVLKWRTAKALRLAAVVLVIVLKVAGTVALVSLVASLAVFGGGVRRL